MNNNCINFNSLTLDSTPNEYKDKIYLEYLNKYTKEGRERRIKLLIIKIIFILIIITISLTIIKAETKAELNAEVQKLVENELDNTILNKNEKKLIIDSIHQSLNNVKYITKSRSKVYTNSTLFKDYYCIVVKYKNNTEQVLFHFSPTTPQFIGMELYRVYSIYNLKLKYN